VRSRHVGSINNVSYVVALALCRQNSFFLLHDVLGGLENCAPPFLGRSFEQILLFILFLEIGNSDQGKASRNVTRVVTELGRVERVQTNIVRKVLFESALVIPFLF
jgi:hypothetical protein